MVDMFIEAWTNGKCLLSVYQLSQAQVNPIYIGVEMHRAGVFVYLSLCNRILYVNVSILKLLGTNQIPYADKNIYTAHAQ